MNQNFMVTSIFQFSPSSSFCIFIISLLGRVALATYIDPFYQACSSEFSCGDGQFIRYPFFVQGQQQPYCGFPGFQVTCNENSKPVLTIQENKFIIHEIFYKNQSLRISNAVFSETNVCEAAPLIRNLSLPDEFIELVSNKTELSLFYNCSSSLPLSLSQYKVDGCANKTNTVLALYNNGSNLDDVVKECRNRVLAPVDVFGDYSGDVGIKETVRRGFVLRWKTSDCSVCETSGGKCGFNASSYHFRCFCLDRPHAAQCIDPATARATVPAAGNKHKRLGLIAGITATGIGMLILLAFCFRKMLLSNNSMIFLKKRSENYQKIEDFLKKHGSLGPKRYNYSDIKKMTNSFKHKLGQGGFGGVYKGKLLDGRDVAVKVLKEAKGSGEEFINEVASISRTSHVNIVTLLGFCFEGSRRALIYEYVPNGSLDKFIYEKTPLETTNKLKWETLYQIAVGIARGLEYLHRGCSTRIFHFDIKPHNILLDKDFCPKISDFGLAKICPQKESVISMTGARGTIGYIAPEVFCRNFGEVSHKSDVYSYGMMVLEMVGGRKNINVEVDHTSEIYFPHWIYNRLELDEELQVKCIANEDDEECARKMIIVSLWCIQTNPSDRPTMSRVVDMLEGSLDSLQIPPKPYLSSPRSRPAPSVYESRC